MPTAGVEAIWASRLLNHRGARDTQLMPPEVIEIRAPAKVNLSLAVKRRRDDGYHEIESWVVKTPPADGVTLRPADALSLRVSGDERVPTDARNLAWRAATRLAEACDAPCRAEMSIEKRIPVGMGLGGGSSDAAAVLIGLQRLWRIELAAERLAGIALDVGSDVPLFLRQSASIIRGRGERISPAPDWSGYLALVVPPFGLSTARVYARWRPGRHRPDDRRPWQHAAAGARELDDRLFNDLEEPAKASEPRLGALFDALDGLAGRRIHMTGSGACLFALFDDDAEAAPWGRRARAAATEPIRVEVVSVGR
jgi:4-diphosphocytidyl-2-C-methyl-D-erythritol kinase